MNDVNSQGSLVRYEAAHRALYVAVSVDEVKDIRDRSLAMEIYAYQQRDAQLVAWSVELKERAGRRLGEVMDEERRAGRLAKGGAEKGVGRRGKNAGLPETRIPTLADHGIDKNLADKARKLAAMSEDKFEAKVAKTVAVAVAVVEGTKEVIAAARAESHQRKRKKRIFCRRSGCTTWPTAVRLPSSGPNAGGAPLCIAGVVGLMPALLASPLSRI
jgi:hypothetical protein